MVAYRKEDDSFCIVCCHKLFAVFDSCGVCNRPFTEEEKEERLSINTFFRFKG